MKYFILSLSLFCILALVSCSTEENPTQPKPAQTGLRVVGEQTSNGINVQLLASDTTTTGYNKLYIKLTKVSTGEIIRNARVSMTPVMDMGMHSHSAPSEQPPHTAAGDVFPAGIVFVMSGMWTIDLDVRTENGEPLAAVSLPVSVVESDRARVVSGTDGKTYIISMGCLCGASVGINDIEFTVHSTEDMMSFLPAEDLSPVMTPDMPSMGHGSPNNVNPVHRAIGHYEGKVNFTMKGEWRITLEVRRGTETLATTSFMTTL
jgi:hypothetical protein